jgi:hypothetical protein
LINNTATEAKYNATVILNGLVGISGDVQGLPCFAETTLRFEVVGVGPTNLIDIQGKIRNSPNWYVLATIPGAVSGTIDISTYDFVRYVTTFVDGTGNLYASGYMLQYQQPITPKNMGSLLSGVSYDEIVATYPTPVTENYQYNLATVSQANILITYTDISKAVFVSAKRV